ncbi:MAG: hypothetical protein J5605_01710 [Bacteroidales bacterium]|nr:hypothetical protein [Bacteroidales bacterium]
MKKVTLIIISVLFCGLACAQYKPSNVKERRPIIDSVELNGHKYLTVSFLAKDDKLMYVMEQIEECGWEFAACQTEGDNTRICAKCPMKGNEPIPVLCIGKFDYPDGSFNFEGLSAYGKKLVTTCTFKNGKLVSVLRDDKDVTPRFVVSPDEKDVW